MVIYENAHKFINSRAHSVRHPGKKDGKVMHGY